MEKEGFYLNCSAAIEWSTSQGMPVRKLILKLASLRLIRNNIRQMLIEVNSASSKNSNSSIKLFLKNINVLNRYIHEGKATIQFNDEKCILLISNAPSMKLKSFLQTMFIKMSKDDENLSKNCLKDHTLGDKLNSTSDVSPFTTGEKNQAKERALSIATSRKTITTPSPSNIRKRKLTDSQKLPIAKKLYVDQTNIELNDEQNAVLDAVLKKKNVFFTGSAGTGKSFLLKQILAQLPPDLTAATASTGVAACHIGGITLHQFAGIGLGAGTLERCYQLAQRPSNASSWRKIKHLIIDEISMIDGDYFDKIEAVARFIRRNDKPFGGIQLILCGDFFQLPPVTNSDHKFFCFQSKSWSKCVECNFELNTVHRQKDMNFIEILNNIRIGRVTEEITDKLYLTSKQKIERDGILATRLCSHVREVDEINTHQLEKLEGCSKLFTAQDSDESMTKILNQQLPVPEKLLLKVGAQVMLLKNLNITSGLVNGARGVILKFVDGIPVVQFRSGIIYHAKPEKFSIKINSGGLVHRQQIPLKLAWAFSIHKSQGLTLDCVEMNLSSVFDAGQAYVALSRAESLQSLRVIDFSAKQVWANPTVLQFYATFRRSLISMISLGKNNQKNST